MGLDWSKIRRQQTCFGERFCVEDFAPPGTDLALLMFGRGSMQGSTPCLLHQIYVKKVAALHVDHPRVDVMFLKSDWWGSLLTGHNTGAGNPTPEWVKAELGEN